MVMVIITGINPMSFFLVCRWKNVIYGAFFYQLCSRYPDWAKKFVKKLMWKAIDGGMSE